MPKLIEKFTYGFEDVSLEPFHYSPVKSRKEVNTTVELNLLKQGRIALNTPIIASPMADVCDDKVAVAMWKAGAIGCIHRFLSIKDEADMVSRVREAGMKCFAAVGTTPDFGERTAALINAGAVGIVVDVAFLNQRTLDACRYIKDKWPGVFLISGNVATGAGFRQGVEAGLDGIRVGIGNGQACRTSRVTGVGIGMVTSLLECLEEKEHAAARGRNVLIICDGGMDVGGSFCKALAAGADLTIMGRSFAATHEAPGRFVTDTGLPYSGFSSPFKEYRGSASMEAQLVYKEHGDIISSEGVASVVKVAGYVADVVGRWNGALRSSMSYLGATNLDDYRKNAIFRLVATGTFNQQKARTLQSREITI
jgi:IMP dehydrogenase/GMP reductase